MIRKPIPLCPNNSKEITQKAKLTDRQQLGAIKHQNFYSLECEEDIGVISFSNKNSYSKELLQLSEDTKEKWSPSDSQLLENSKNIELEYMPNPYYLQTMQPFITGNMRMILYDWMIEVCSELLLKRETFFLAVNYCDRYLSRNPSVNKEIYQLIGLSCMYLASKIEEVNPPSIIDWGSSADNGYSFEEIIDMEKKLLKGIDFKVFPITAYNWLNWLMTQWDNYIEFHFGCVPGNNPKDFKQMNEGKKTMKKKYEERMILFKQANQKAYRRYRESMQMLDIGALHPGSLKFLPRYLACGLFYLMVSKYFFETRYALIYYNESFKENIDENKENFFDDNYDVDPFHIESTSIVQELFVAFLAASAGIGKLEEIYEVVSFYHPLLEFEAAFELPVACRFQSKSKLESHSVVPL